MMSFLINQKRTPEQAQDAMRQAQTGLAMSPPTDIGSGVNALAQALMMRHQMNNAQFPEAPGGAKPSMMTGFQNMFKLGGKGLY